MKRFFSVLLLICLPLQVFAKDPLPSWNEGQTKTAILSFVTRVTDEGSKGFVPPAERIATFDFDGTLMGEKPVFLQGSFLNFLAEKAMAENPSLADDPNFQALVNRDSWQQYFDTVPWDNTLKVYAATHTGMTQKVFSEMAKSYMQSHQQYRRTLFQPMIELLALLRENDFKPYIVTGSENQFLRAFAEEYLGFPPEQVIGTTWKTEVQEVDGKVTLKRLPEINFINDKKGKIQAIDLHIGRVPIFAAGNDGNAGDIYMLRYATQDKERPSLGLLVAHDDGMREAAYTDKDGASLAAAKQYGWSVARVKTDWKTIYPPIGNRNSVQEMR